MTTLASVTKSVFQYFKGATGAGEVSTLVGGRMYNTAAPDNATLPFIVFYIQEIVPERYLGSLNIEEAKVRFVVVDSAKYDVTNSMVITDALRTRFDDAQSLSFSGGNYSTMKFVAESLGGPEVIEDRFETISMYNFQISTT